MIIRVWFDNMNIKGGKVFKNLDIQIYNFPSAMSLHCAFLFPKNKFQLTFMTTIGYFSDNVYYRLNLSTGQTQIKHNPNGRSYQALTASHKRGLTVLADYGKNPNFYFDFQHSKQKSFEAKDICQLQITMLAVSLDIHYLLICCGVPEKSLMIYDIQKKRLLKGPESAVKIGDRIVKKIDFNPNNNRMFAVQFQNCMQVYEFCDSFEISGANSEKQQLKEIIQIKKTAQIPSNSANCFQTFIWDQINNLYISNRQTVFIYSIDSKAQVINYDLQGDFDEHQNVISNFILTKKHLIIVYTNGRMEWVNKYYPDLMEEEDFTLRPFYLQNYFEFQGSLKNATIRYSCYDHNFQKILVAHGNGFFTILDKPAESNEIDEDQLGNSRRKQERAGVNEKNKKIQIQLTQFGPYHINHIIYCKQIPNTALVMTISKSGRVVFWSETQKTALAYYDVGKNIISADVNSAFTVLSISKTGGLVQFFSLADLQNIFLFKQFKLLNEGEIDQVGFSKNCDELACLSCSNKQIFYILTKQRQEFQVLGYVKLPYTPISMCWNKSSKSVIKPKYQNLFVCIGFGVISINSPPATSEKRKGKDLELTCEMHGLRTDLEQKVISVLPNGEIITSGNDTFIKKYKQPDQPIAKFNPQAKSAIPPPIEEIEAHDLDIAYMEIYDKKFISCGRDGTVQLRNIDNFGNFETVAVQGWKNGNLSACALSQEDGLFFTCGKDGLVSMWKNKDIQIKNSDQLIKRSTDLKKIDGKGLNCKFYETVIQEEYLQRMKDAISKKKKVQIQKVQKIKNDLKELLIENEGHDELQKLERDEFVIDLQSRDVATKKMMENCEQIKKTSIKKVLHNQVYKKKLQELTWDQMEEHLRGINGLKNNYLVYNYQIRKVKKFEKRRLQMILDLRRNQIRELKKRGGNQIIDPDFYKNKNVINGGILQPLILTIFEKKDDKKEEKGKKKKDEDVAEKQPEDLEEIPKDEDWTLLYSSFQLFSENAKKNQIVMMQNLIIKIKQAFNKEFNKLLKLRQNQNEIINDKNKRIIEICDQLKRAHDIIVSNKNILENPDTVLQIDPKEIPFTRYLSREERQKLEKERLKEEERLRLLAEDDSSQRALQQMMGGTLQQKKASLLQATMERQKWMDKPQEEMTQEEKAKLKEFQQKKQKAEEQKERIIKKLEAELRKLRQEIDETMEKYDEKLFNLIRRRIQYDLRIEQQQLYCLKLNLSMVNQKEESKKFHILREKIAQTEAKALDLQNYLREFEKQYDIIVEQSTKSAKQHEPKVSSQNEPKVKTVEKSVFDDYQTNMKKRREIEQKLLQSNKLAQYQINPMDPMKDIQSRILAQENSRSFKFFIPEIKNLQQTFDFPDSLLQVLEARFNHKLHQAEYETKLKNIKEAIMEIQQHIGQHEKQEQKDQQELESIKNYLEKCKSDLQIQCRIKQGQVQIDNNTPIPKLNDALLISKSAIDEKNANILEKAGLKIDVIKQIKSCKIQVTEETLNLERKQSLIDQLSSMIKQVQMLKVKKEMQTALAKKDTKINQNEIKSLKEQIQKVRKEGEKRITLFEKKIEKVLQQIDSIKKENKQLEVQKWNLENTVKQREKIKEMMVGENGGGNQQAAEKFQQISINRKLFDKAKQQTEEIELLRQELSKLKAKTFANFSSVQR